MEEQTNHDALWESTYTPEDRETVKKIAADSLMAGGSYRKVGTAVVTKGDYEGRAQANVLVRLAVLADPEEKVVGTQFIRVSPVRMNRLDQEKHDTGKPDRQSQLYQQAYQAFKAVAGRDPESPLEVLDFLENQPYRVRVIQVGTQEGATGEPGNMVVGISAIREG